MLMQQQVHQCFPNECSPGASAHAAQPAQFCALELILMLASLLQAAQCERGRTGAANRLETCTLPVAGSPVRVREEVRVGPGAGTEEVKVVVKAVSDLHGLCLTASLQPGCAGGPHLLKALRTASG